MGWFFKKEVKETEEAKDTNETNDTNDEFVSEFDRRYKVDEKDPSQYKYHETEDDPTKGKESGKKADTGTDDDDVPDPNRNNREKDDEGR